LIWPRLPLEVVAEVCGGGTPSRSQSDYWGGSIAWITPSDLPMPGAGIAEIGDAPQHITEASLKSCSAVLLPPGAVLFSSRATIGKLGIASVPLATNQGFVNFVPKSGVDSRYLAYCLLRFTSEIEELAGSTTFREVRRGALRKFTVPVPPLSEQRRIVAILDQTDALRRKRAEADAKAARILPALFIKMFGDPIQDKSEWPRKTLTQVCVEGGIKPGPFGSSLKKSCYTASGPRVYGQEQVIAGDFGIGDYHISDELFDEMNDYAVEPGDVLLSLVGTIGRAVVVPSTANPGIINPRLLRLRPRPECVTPEFLCDLLTGSSASRFFNSVAGGFTMGVLNARVVKKLEFSVPPLGLQEDYVSHVTQLHGLLDLRAQCGAQLDRLLEALLQRAFAEQLTAGGSVGHTTALLEETAEQAKAPEVNRPA